MLQPPPIRLADVANASYKITTNVLLIMLAREGGREGNKEGRGGQSKRGKSLLLLLRPGDAGDDTFLLASTNFSPSEGTAVHLI